MKHDTLATARMSVRNIITELESRLGSVGVKGAFVFVGLVASRFLSHVVSTPPSTRGGKGCLITEVVS